MHFAVDTSLRTNVAFLFTTSRIATKTKKAAHKQLKTAHKFQIRSFSFLFLSWDQNFVKSVSFLKITKLKQEQQCHVRNFLSENLSNSARLWSRVSPVINKKQNIFRYQPLICWKIDSCFWFLRKESEVIKANL